MQEQGRDVGVSEGAGARTFHDGSRGGGTNRGGFSLRRRGGAAYRHGAEGRDSGLELGYRVLGCRGGPTARRGGRGRTGTTDRRSGLVDRAEPALDGTDCSLCHTRDGAHEG